MKLYLYITNADAFLNGDSSFHAAPEDHHADNIPGWFLAGSIDVELDVDNKKITQSALDSIDKAEQKEIAEHEIKMGMLKEKKANLLSITHQP